MTGIIENYQLTPEIQFDYTVVPFHNHLKVIDYSSGSNHLGDFYAVAKGQSSLPGVIVKLSAGHMIIDTAEEKDLRTVTHALLEEGVRLRKFSRAKAIEAEEKFQIAAAIKVPAPAKTYFQTKFAEWLDTEDLRFNKSNRKRLRDLGLDDDKIAKLEAKSSVRGLQEVKYDLGFRDRHSVFTELFAAAEEWEKGARKAVTR